MPHDRHVVRDEQHRQTQPLAQVGEQVEARWPVPRRRAPRPARPRSGSPARARARGRSRCAAADRPRTGADRRRARSGAGPRDRAAHGSARRRRRAARVVDAQQLGQRLADGHAGVEGGVRILEDHLHTPPVDCRALGRHDLSLEEHLALGRLVEPTMHARASTCRSPTRRRGRAPRARDRQVDAVNGAQYVHLCTADTAHERGV